MMRRPPRSTRTDTRFPTRRSSDLRNRSGKRVPPQFQRMAAEDFVAQVFPDQIACQENRIGPRTVPGHPLVQQTIHDCLTEARSEEHTSELQSLMRISYAVFCLKTKTNHYTSITHNKHINQQ